MQSKNKLKEKKRLSKKIVAAIRRRPDERLNEHLKKNGYVIGNIDCISTDPTNQEELKCLVELAKNELKPDVYDKTGLRNRAMGKFLITPYTQQLIDIERLETDFGDHVCPYYQSSEHNQDMNKTGSNVRLFPAISAEMMANPVLQRLVIFALKKAISIGCVQNGDLITSNIQFVQQIVANRSEVCFTSPAVLHVDGEPFTAIILAERSSNAIGGENFVSERDQQGRIPSDAEEGSIRAQVTLEAPFDFLMVDDRAVAHHVNGITSYNNSPASRMTILIDFSPWRQKLTQNLLSGSYFSED